MSENSTFNRRRKSKILYSRYVSISFSRIRNGNTTRGIPLEKNNLSEIVGELLLLSFLQSFSCLCAVRSLLEGIHRLMRYINRDSVCVSFFLSYISLVVTKTPANRCLVPLYT